MRALLWLAAVVALTVPASSEEDDGSDKRYRVLSFGGNGNIGSEVLHRLIQRGE